MHTVGTGQYLFECTPSRPPPHQAPIHRTLEEPKKDFCTAQTTEVFAHTVVADPHCLASQKYQPSISAFLKYLPSFKLRVLRCTPNQVILGSLNQGRDGRTGGIHRSEKKTSFVRNPERNRLRRKPGRTLKNDIETHIKQMKWQGVDWLHLMQMCIRHVNVKCPYP